MIYLKGWHDILQGADMNELDCRTLPVPSFVGNHGVTHPRYLVLKVMMKVFQSPKDWQRSHGFSPTLSIYLDLGCAFKLHVWSYWGRNKTNQNIDVLHQAVLKSLTERIENSEAKSAAKSTNRPVAIPIAIWAPAADWKPVNMGRQNRWRDVEFHESWYVDSSWFKFINSLYIWFGDILSLKMFLNPQKSQERSPFKPGTRMSWNTVQGFQQPMPVP